MFARKSLCQVLLPVDLSLIPSPLMGEGKDGGDLRSSPPHPQPPPPRGRGSGEKSQFLAALGVLLLLLTLPKIIYAENDLGVLVLAHGGSAQWNKAVKVAVKGAQLPYPTRVYFGMGMSQDEAKQLEKELRALEAKDVHSIVAIPLLISSYSEVYRQWRYLLGVDVKPGFINNPLFPLEHRTPIRFTEPLNDDVLVADILVDRAQQISQHPDKESVLIVAHGPNDDFDNTRWMDTLKALSTKVSSRGGFKSVEGLTLRDDAPAEVRGQAVQSLRNRVETINRENGRALVIPLLLAPGGIEQKIRIELKGLEYVSNLNALLPDSRISQWIRNRAIP